MKALQVTSQITKMLNYFLKKSEDFWKNPKTKTKNYLIQSIECLAFLKDWQKVVDMSSRAVFKMNSFKDRQEFYYIWMTGLIELSDITGLKFLSKHLKDFYRDEDGAFALSELSEHFLTRFQNINSQSLISLSEKNALTKELKSYLLIYQNSLEEKKKGLIKLKEVSTKEKTNYFRVRNFLRAFSDNDLTKQMTDLYNSMHRKFPFSPEPYIVSALVSLKRKDWNHASRLFSQLAIDNPKEDSYANLTQFCVAKLRQKRSHMAQNSIAS